MSTRSSVTVERVVNSSPHEQRTAVSLYSGWMPCFIGTRSPRVFIGVAGSYTGNDLGRSGIPHSWLVDVGPLDVAEEVDVGLALAHPVHHQLEGLGGVEGAEDAAQLPGHDQLLLGEQELLLPRGGGVDVKGGEDAALGQLAVQADLHVPGALELLEDDLVHARPGVDQGGGQDGQRPALFQVAGGPEEPLGRVQGRGVDAAGEDLAAGRGGQVVGPRQPGDAVEQHDHVAAVLDQPLGPLDGQLGDLAVLLAGPVEGRVDDVRLGRALHVGDLFGPLVGEQDDEVHLGVVLADGVGDLLHQRGLAGLGRGDDHAPLALPDRAHQVHDPGRDLGRVVLQAQPLQRVQRRQVLEVAAVARLLGIEAVDLVDPGEGGVLLGVAGQLDRALDLVAAAQAHPADHRQGHVHVLGPRQVVVDPQEAVAVLGADVEGAGAADLGPVVGLLAVAVVGPLQQGHVALVVEAAAATTVVAVAVPVAVAPPASALALLVVPAVAAAALAAPVAVAVAALATVAPALLLVALGLAAALDLLLALGGLAALDLLLALGALGPGGRGRARL